MTQTTKIELKNGKTYTGFWNGNIYGDKIYINRPINGSIHITYPDGQSFDSPRKGFDFRLDEIATDLRASMPRTTGTWMREMESAENQ